MNKWLTYIGLTAATAGLVWSFNQPLTLSAVIVESCALLFLIGFCGYMAFFK